jgi:hypothetical protein
MAGILLGCKRTIVLHQASQWCTGVKRHVIYEPTPVAEAKTVNDKNPLPEELKRSLSDKVKVIYPNIPMKFTGYALVRGGGTSAAHHRQADGTAPTRIPY